MSNNNTLPSILPPCQDTNIQIPSSSSQLKVDTCSKMLELCKRKYFQVMDLQYELKNKGGNLSTAKFLYKDDLEYALKEAEELTMELWRSSRRPPESHEWEENEQIIKLIISEVNSEMKIENTKNFTRYVEEGLNKICNQIDLLKQFFGINYPALCSDITMDTFRNGEGEGDHNLRKFYSPEKLKNTMDCMISQVTKACQQFALKLNRFCEEGVKSTLVLAELQKEVTDWSSNLISRNGTYVANFHEYVGQSIIQPFVNEARSEIERDQRKRPVNLKSTLKIIDTKLQSLAQSSQREIKKICNDFALDNSTQLLEHSKGVLQNHRDDIRAEAIERWRKRCQNLSKNHHDKLKPIYDPRKTKTTPKFVLDTYGKHLEEARKEIEANILEIEEPLPPIPSDDDDDYDDALKTIESPSQSSSIDITEQNAENSGGTINTSDHRTSPIASTSSAAVRYWYNEHSEDDEPNNKRRKSF